MLQLLSCLIVLSSLANATPNIKRQQSIKDPSETLRTWPSVNGGTYQHAISLNMGENPYTLGISIKGNGVDDELHLKVDTDSEVSNLQINNRPNGISIYLHTQKFAVIGKQSEPGTLTVIDDGKCHNKLYNRDNPKQNPTNENIDDAKCIQLMEEYGMPPPLKKEDEISKEKSRESEDSQGNDMTKEKSSESTDSQGNDMAKEKPSGSEDKPGNSQLRTWPWVNGGTYEHAISLQKGEKPYTLGISIKGNGVEDQLHLKVDSESEVTNLQINNQNSGILIYSHTYKYAVIGKKSQPDTLTVIENGKCKIKIYNNDKPEENPTVEETDSAKCVEIMEEYRLPIPGRNHVEEEEEEEGEEEEAHE